jgi:predicted transcriptional regulator
MLLHSSCNISLGVAEVPHKRSRLEIYIDILKIISKGSCKPTRIMYSSNLSWKPLKKALESMSEQGLITEEKNGIRSNYYVTDKGKVILNYFKEATRLLEIK